MAVFLTSFFGAVLSALGMGGGGILLIYLTVYAGMEQLTAQGINLVFFIPIALVALIIHSKNKLIRWEVVWPCALLGLLGVWGGAQLAVWIGSQTLSKLFGGFLLIVGTRELLMKKTVEKNG